MNIVTYKNNSDPRKISKSLTAIGEEVGNLVNETNIVEPVILLAGVIPGWDYCYIEQFDRYYYVADFRSVRNGIIEVHLKSDPLMSFNLNGISGIVKETESVGGDPYLDGRGYVAKVKDKTDIITFPYGLLDSGEYILITAGGGQS